MLIETISQPWVRALAVNKREGLMDPLMVWNGPPEAANPNTQSGYNARGVFDLGQGGGTSSQRVKVMPFCEGQPGSVFWTTVYGWNPVQGDETNPLKAAWIFNLLAQFMCVVGDIKGPEPVDNVQTTNALLKGERVCDSLSLVGGVLGLSGFICSSFPGSGYPAYAAFETFGARKVSFDFACEDPGMVGFPGLGMNCFWARL